MTTEDIKNILSIEGATIDTVDETNSTLTEDSSSSVLPIVFMFVAGVSGNILAIVLLYKTSQKHKWRTFYRLVFVLAVSDLFGLIGPLPVIISIYSNNRKWIGGQPLCDYMSFTSLYAGMTSAMFAAAMSLDRFLAVWFPFTYNGTISNRRVNLTMIGLCTFAFILACLPLIGLNHNSIQFPGTWCFFDQFSTEPGDMFFAFLYASLGLLMVVVMVVMNMFVTLALIKRRVLTSDRELRADDVYNIVFLVVLMVVFTICWLPLMIRIILNQSGAVEPNDTHDKIVARLALANQVIDPWVYILLRKDTIAPIITAVKRFVDTGSCLQHDMGDERNSNTTRKTHSTTAGNESFEELKEVRTAHVQCTASGESNG